MSGAEFTVVDVLDAEHPCRCVGVQIWAIEQIVGISNTTEHDVRIVVGGEERVLCPSPRRGECIVDGLILFRVSGDFDFRAVGDAELEEPVELDALCAELLLPGGEPGVH